MGAPAPSVRLPSLCSALPAASVVNGNLVSMAAGKINADKVTQEGEGTLVASGLMSPLPHLTWPGGHITHHVLRAPVPNRQHTGVPAVLVGDGEPQINPELLPLAA